VDISTVLCRVAASSTVCALSRIVSCQFASTYVHERPVDGQALA
jgi:hypothetical protein